jgi:uncharacterized membrane protein YhaH (DUF805 family)
MIDKADWSALLHSWDGLLRRSHFWIGMAALCAVNMILGILPLVGALISLVLIAPAAAISARRLHDMGRSARFALIPVVVSIFAGLLSLAASAAPAAFGVAGAIWVLAMAGPLLLLVPVLLVINLAFVLWIGLSAGCQGANAYGADPRSAEA